MKISRSQIHFGLEINSKPNQRQRNQTDKIWV